MTRHPTSLHGVPRDGSPASSVLLRCYDSPESFPPRFVSFAWRYRGYARRFAPTGCGRPLPGGRDLWSSGGQPELDRGDLRGLPGSWADPYVHMPWAGTPGDPRRQAVAAPRMLPSAHPTTSAPRSGLSRLMTTACTLAVYASQRRVTPTLRKTRFRWVASPCRVGFGPTGPATKGFRFCLLHVPSSLPRLGLARGASPTPQRRTSQGSSDAGARWDPASLGHDGGRDGPSYCGGDAPTPVPSAGSCWRTGASLRKTVRGRGVDPRHETPGARNGRAGPTPDTPAAQARLFQSKSGTPRRRFS